MDEVAYLILEIPALDEVAVGLTAEFPGIVLDEVVWHGPSQAGTLAYHITALARNVPAGLMDRVIAQLAVTSSQIETHRRDDEAGTWLGTMVIPPERLMDPVSLAITEFNQHHDVQARWIRIENGTLFVKCEVPQDGDPHALAEQLRGFMEAKHIDADVGVEFAARGQFAPWEELIESIVEEAGFSIPPGFGL